MALKGIKVLELAGLAPAPFCGMILADFGATVIRIDRINSNSEIDCLGNGKKSIALNIKHPKGIEIIKKLSRNSDVLLEPFRSGVMEKMGLGPQVLLKENPRLVYARLTGYGQGGPYSQKAGHDINYLALSGLMSLIGRNGEKPMFPVNFASDFAGGGLVCALGIVLALFERHSSNLGQIIDASMVEGTAYLSSWLYRSQSLPIWGQPRGNNYLDSGTHFYEVYETKDKKYLSVGALEPQFYEQLMQGLNLNLPQFEDFDLNKEILTKKFKEKTLEEWMQIFDKLDACVAPVVELQEASQHPHNVEQKSFAKDMVPNPAPKLSRTPGVSSASKRIPQCGENTKEILQEFCSEEDVEKLEAEGVVQCFNSSKL